MKREEQRLLNWLGYTIREFRTPETSIPADSVLHRCRQGDMLDYLSYLYFRRHDLWYLIADVNGIMDPFFKCEGGERLIIPKR